MAKSTDRLRGIARRYVEHLSAGWADSLEEISIHEEAGLRMIVEMIENNPDLKFGKYESRKAKALLNLWTQRVKAQTRLMRSDLKNLLLPHIK